MHALCMRVRNARFPPLFAPTQPNTAVVSFWRGRVVENFISYLLVKLPHIRRAAHSPQPQRSLVGFFLSVVVIDESMPNNRLQSNRQLSRRDTIIDSCATRQSNQARVMLNHLEYNMNFSDSCGLNVCERSPRIAHRAVIQARVICLSMVSNVSLNVMSSGRRRALRSARLRCRMSTPNKHTNTLRALIGVCILHAISVYVEGFKEQSTTEYFFRGKYTLVKQSADADAADKQQTAVHRRHNDMNENDEQKI